MPNSTRETFYNAIAQASTPVVAAGLVKALHVANMRELFEQLEQHDAPSGYFIDEEQFRKLKQEYTTA